VVKTATDVRDIIRCYVDKPKRDIKVQRVILYGSYARGKPREESDIDIAVISDDFAKTSWVQRQELLGVRMLGCDTHLAPIGYTFQEYVHPQENPFLEEIIRTGVVMFEG